jgi:DNA polymerase-1
MPTLEPRRPGVYLIDGSAYIYRAFFALPALSNSRGMQTNAVYGFTTMLMKILREHQPEYLAIVFDEKGPTKRHEQFKEYKAQRPEMPQGMEVQVPYIHRVVEAMGLPVVRCAGYEADDLIGTLGRKAEADGLQVVIVTSDKDMFQLLTAGTRIYDPVKDRWFDEADCRERFGVEPGRVVEIMALMGDSIDNIPGVKGIGEKTAVKLITQFDTVEELLNRLDEVTPPRVRTMLQEQADNARLSRQLATIELDCPIEFDRARFRVVPPPTEPLVALLRELEFPTLLKALQPTPAAQKPLEKAEQIDQEAAERFAESLEPQEPVAIQCVLAGIGSTARLEGLGLAGVRCAVCSVLPLPHSIERLLGGVSRTKAGHDLKQALLALRRAEVDMAAPFFDTMIAAYLLNPNRRSPSLEAVALDALGYHFEAMQAQGKAGPGALFDETGQADGGRASQEQSLQRAAESASVISRLVPVLRERLTEQGSHQLFEEVEMPLLGVLAEIEQTGFALDVGHLEAVGKEMEREIQRITETMTRLAGEEFNPNSPKQLATVLFEKLGLKPLRKTKTGYSTDEDTLTQLAAQHELPALILTCRTLTKLQSTYVDGLRGQVNPTTARVHTSLNQTVAATGRLSSTEPNLQNIPVKGEFGLRIREAFVAAPGHLLLSADYSQIEPRILAHLSQDERLLQVFSQGEDIHAATAVDIFNLAADQITREMRRVAKTVVFGILYGISPFGLSQTLGIPQQDAKKYIDAYFARYAGVKQFLDRTLAEARQCGYVTTILGRRRPIPELSSRDATQRGFGERMAINNPIQGSAADLIKVAMIAINRRLHAELPATKMLLQVHDELIFETPEKDLEAAKHLVKSEMEETGVRLGLTVPLQVDLGVGRNWREAHP